MAEIIYYLREYKPLPCGARIQWLTEDDCGKLNEHLVLCGQQPMADEKFRALYRQGIARYCLLYADGIPVTRGAVEPYSDEAWEAADIRTVRAFRSKGYAKDMLRFLSRIIQEHGKIVSCRTDEDNFAMQKVLEAIGFHK